MPPELACLSCGFSSEAAREASYRSLHYHGGYGFMVEFDIQLYFRRARAWPAVFGDPVPHVRTWCGDAARAWLRTDR